MQAEHDFAKTFKKTRFKKWVIPLALIVFIPIVLFGIFVLDLWIPKHENHLDQLREWGYFQNTTTESGEVTFVTPRSWRNPFLNLIKPCGCFYGKAVIESENMQDILEKYTWTSWTISVQDWAAQRTFYDGFDAQVVHPTMFEFDKLKTEFIGKSFVVSPDFEGACMQSTFLKPCHCYLIPSERILYFYCFTD